MVAQEGIRDFSTVSASERSAYSPTPLGSSSPVGPLSSFSAWRAVFCAFDRAAEVSFACHLAHMAHVEIALRTLDRAPLTDDRQRVMPLVEQPAQLVCAWNAQNAQGSLD